MDPPLTRSLICCRLGYLFKLILVVRGFFKPAPDLLISVFDRLFLDEKGAAKLRLTSLTPTPSIAEPAIESFKRLLFTRGTPALKRFDMKPFVGRCLEVRTGFYMLFCLPA